MRKKSTLPQLSVGPSHSHAWPGWPFPVAQSSSLPVQNLPPWLHSGKQLSTTEGMSCLGMLSEPSSTSCEPAGQHQRDGPDHFSPEAKQDCPLPEGVYPHNIHHHLGSASGTFIFKRGLSSTLKTTLKRINAGESPAAQQGTRWLIYTRAQNSGAKPQRGSPSWWRGPGTGHLREAGTWIFLHKLLSSYIDFANRGTI